MGTIRREIILTIIVGLLEDGYQYNATKHVAKRLNDKFRNLVTWYKVGKILNMNGCVTIRTNIINIIIISYLVVMSM